MMDENERLKIEKQMSLLKEQNAHSQMASLQKVVTHMKKENELHE